MKKIEKIKEIEKKIHKIFLSFSKMKTGQLKNSVFKELLNFSEEIKCICKTF